MRNLAFAIALPFLLVAALVLPFAVDAQQIKQVEVTNLPAVQDVFVTSPPVRFQLVGFTPDDYDGDMGGWFGTTDKCQMDFAGARICTFDEVRNTTTIPVLPSGTGAWAFDVGASRTCGDWTFNNPGGTIGPIAFLVSSDTGVKDGAGAKCETFHRIACCALVP